MITELGHLLSETRSFSAVAFEDNLNKMWPY